MFKYTPKKPHAKYEYALIGSAAFLTGAVFSFLPMAFRSDLWWVPLVMMSLGLMMLGAVSIHIGAMREGK